MSLSSICRSGNHIIRSMSRAKNKNKEKIFDKLYLELVDAKDIKEIKMISEKIIRQINSTNYKINHLNIHKEDLRYILDSSIEKIRKIEKEKK